MADIRPFQGLRYDPRRVPLGDVVCPPFDVITPEEQQALYTRHPHNIVRVELGNGLTDPAAAGNRYDSAAELLRRWQTEGILVREDAPSFYVYDHTFAYGGRSYRRRGLMVAGRLHDWSEEVVLPHEATRAGPKEDRLALLRAAKTNVSPLWLVYHDPGGEVRQRLEMASQGEPTAVAEAPPEPPVAAGRHVLYAISEPEAVRRIVDLFAARRLYIADGHHRYETAQMYRDERRRAASTAGQARDSDAGYEFALMVLVALEDPGLLVLPTHRLVRGLERANEEIRGALGTWFTLAPLEVPAGDETPTGAWLEQALAAAALDGGHVFGLLEDGGAWLLHPRPDVDWARALPADRSAAWRGLDVSVLDTLAMREALGIRAEGEAARADATSHAPSDRLAYVSSFAGAVAAVRRGDAAQAYLLNPTRLDQVCAVADARDRMPPKSTYLYPKPATGMIMHPLDGKRWTDRETRRDEPLWDGAVKGVGTILRCSAAHGTTPNSMAEPQPEPGPELGPARRTGVGRHAAGGGGVLRLRPAGGTAGGRGERAGDSSQRRVADHLEPGRPGARARHHD